MSLAFVRGVTLCVAGFVFFAAISPAVQAAEPMHGVAMHGEPKYDADFTHLDYVNPDAPKGGTLRMAAAGTFDSLNPYIVKGVAAPGLGLVFQSLLISTDDEAFSEYGLIAESLEMPDDRSSVTFNLRKEARWHDGEPVTAEDVVWSFKTLMEEGHPFYRAYYANVSETVVENAHRVTFKFDMAGNRELPLIIGQMPVLPKHFWEGKEFASTSLEQVPMGSGPYKIKEVIPGRKIVYERVKDWWAKDLPIMKGQHNFDQISYDMFRDETVMIQALLAGEYDFRQENIAKSWATEYDHKAVEQGLIKKEEIPHEIGTGMQAFVYNIRRDIFADPKVRRALAFAFDFEWSNKQFAYGTYKRTTSYFSNSELAAKGLPSEAELKILEPFRAQLPEEVFTKPYSLPVNDGTGRDMRQNLSKAAKMLEEAGWILNDKKLREKNGKVLSFEILLNSPSFERWIAPFIANLKKLGVEANMRVVDTAQYQARIDSFDFDMTVKTFPQSLSPGNEQREYWGSDKADDPGSRNIIGIKNPVIDALIERVIAAKNRDDLVTATRALDRVLLWHHYVIPQWHINTFRVAYWNKFGHPEQMPKYSLGMPQTWWYDASKADKIDAVLKNRKAK